MEIVPGTIPAMLMERILPDMDVLEFGCATGRMTRYMKEEKNCRVWIVEIDSEAYQIASTYASGGWCGDAEHTDWLEVFSGKKFDRILFADVLEHLRDPGRVLEMAGTLLKEDGEILVSIPNIAHFDILANLMQNSFPYTRLGLLDNTHVHFWGYQDLQPFFEKTGLTITVLDGVYVPPFTTEQDVSAEDVSPLLQDALLRMPLHTVYQFFIVAQKTEWTMQNGTRFENRLIPYGNNMDAYFFWDTGFGYQEDQWTRLHPEMDENSAVYRFRTQIPERCHRVRFDPAEGSFCLVSRLQAVSDRGICEFAPLNGICIEGLLIFAVTDPQIEIILPEGACELELTVSIYPVLGHDWKRLITQMVVTQNTCTRLMQEAAHITEENSHLQAEKIVLEAAHARLLEEKSAIETHNSALLTRINLLTEQIGVQTEQLKQSREETQIWLAQYYAISNAQWWKITAPLRKVVSAFKRTRCGRLLCKGLSYWRTNGFRAVVRKTRNFLMNKTSSCTLVITKPIENFSALASTFAKGRNTEIYLERMLANYDVAKERKVLVLSHELNLTGAPVAILRLTEILKENGYLPVVVSPHNGVLAHNFKASYIPVLLCPQLYTSDMIRHFAGLFDIIIANTIVSAPAVTALYGFSKPVVWWVHEAEVSYNSDALTAMPKILPDNVHVYAGGAYAKARLLSHRPAWNVRELLYYIPDLIEGAEPYTLPEKAEGKIVFACIGMLEQRKGQDILVNALESLSEEQVRRGYYIFVGRQCYEPCYESIMTLRNRFPENVLYIEELPIEDVRRLFQRIDCLICCSRDDPMPIVVTEAMAASKLVICSEHTGFAAILRTDGSGLVYNNNDPKELAGCIARVLKYDDELDGLRKLARRSYETHFSKEVFTQSIVNVMDGLKPVEPEDLPIGRSLTMAALATFFHAHSQCGDCFYLEETARSYDTVPGVRRVLLLSHELSRTGAPVVLYFLARSLQKQGAQVIVMTRETGPLLSKMAEDGIPVIAYTCLNQDNFLVQHAEIFDLIVVNTIVPFWAVEQLRFSKTPVLWWVHDSLAAYEEGGFANLLPSPLPENVKIFCGGEYARTQLLKFYPEYSADVLYYASPDEAAMEVPVYEMHRDPAKFAFAVIGQQDFRKGHDVFAAAIELLTEEERAQAQFYFFGQHLDKRIQAAVDGVCKRYSANVFYIPQVNRKELLSVYRQCPCIVCSSRDDPLPVFVTEAMMMSNIIICSANTGSAPILEKENAGLLYYNNDPMELAARMRTVLANPESFASMRQNARKAYETYFSQSIFEKKTGELLCTMARRIDNGFSGTVSVVIPAYNAGSTMETLLNRLFSQRGVRKVEIVVVDSGSTDGTPELCRKHGAKVVEISQSEFSHSYSRNLGAKTACGDILLFMTQDAMPVNKNWMSSLIGPIVSGEAAAVSCRELCPEGTDLYYQIAAWNHADFMGIRENDRLYHIELNETAESLRRKASLSDVSTAIDARVFKKFLYRFNYAEDLDMGLRLLKSGHAIKLLASTQTIHGHNRLAGYYLKRSYVEAKTLVSIEPQWGVPRQTLTAVARKVTYGAGLLSHALENMLAEQSDPCGLDVFVAALQKHFLTALEDRLTSGYLCKQDDLVDWCIRTMEPFGQESSPDEAELFNDVCYYLDSIIRPYMVAHGLVSLDKTVQEVVCDCLVKHFCMVAGSTLAGIGQNEPVYKTLQILGEGV